MSTFDDLPPVLRRRAKSLLSDGYNDQFCAALMRAADELVVRRRCSTDLEQTAVDQLGATATLRRCLFNIAGIVAKSTMEKAHRREIAQNLNIAHLVKDPGEAMTIMSIEIVKTETFEAFLERVKELYDQHTGGATHGPESETEEAHAGGAEARVDDDQQPGAEERHHGAAPQAVDVDRRQEERLRSAGQPGADDRGPTEDRAAARD